MKLKKRKISGREKDEASIRFLGQLREKLYSGDISNARCAAFNLSWMQEDGLDILTEALFSRAPRRTKSAAAYGLRKMHGRMKNTALDVFKQGLEHPDSGARDVCRTALLLMSGKIQRKYDSKSRKRTGKFEIREIPTRDRHKREIHKRGRGKSGFAGQEFFTKRRSLQALSRLNGQDGLKNRKSRSNNPPYRQ